MYGNSASRNCDQNRPPGEEPGRPASRSMVTVTSWSRNFVGAGGRRWKSESIAPGILISSPGLNAFALLIVSGSVQRRRCSKSFSPSVKLKKLDNK